MTEEEAKDMDLEHAATYRPKGMIPLGNGVWLFPGNGHMASTGRANCKISSPHLLAYTGAVSDPKSAGAPQ